jgi:DNA-binding beta-propeller fold protein YncE
VIARHLLLVGIVALAACGDSQRPTPGALPLAMQSPGPTTLLRLPSKGGTVQAYRSGDLSRLDWQVAKVPDIRRVVGADLDQALVYVLDSTRSLLAIDLRAKRMRTIRKGVRAAALSADGSLFVADTGGRVTSIGRRRTLQLDGAVPSDPGTLVGTQQGHLLVLPSAKRAGLTLITDDQPAAEIDLPAGVAVATQQGDLVAVAAENEVVLLDPSRPTSPKVLSVRGGARAVTFSPSGHRLYVAQDRDELREYDRYAGDWRSEIDLPGPARAVRTDLYGTRVLVRSAEGDTVWVVDPAAGQLVATLEADWSVDLPLLAPPSYLVARRGKDVVTVDLSGAAPDERGRVGGGAGDLWVAVGWSPERPEPIAADSTVLSADSIALADDSTAGSARLYLQVSSSRNADWARELSEKISAAGVAATVLKPASGDDVYRVVVGPYATRDQADSASRKLGMPSFVVSIPGSKP